VKSLVSSRAGAGLRRAALFVCCLPLSGALACEQKSSDLREWRVSDHDHTDNPASGQVQVDPNDAGAPSVPGLDDVTIVAWQQNCLQCHGTLGRGDGPRGPMLKATNLSDPVWQSSASDEQIARVIKEGKGLMPAFKLPDPTVASLVKLVRVMGAAQLGPGGVPVPAPSGASAVGTPGSAPSAAGSATPALSATPWRTRTVPSESASSPKPTPMPSARPTPSSR